ncbi:hypothetical protein ACFL43_05625 [Thermodesulfobacteriota bacterium]
MNSTKKPAAHLLPYWLLVSAFTLFSLIGMGDDPDLWGHTLFGLDILQTGAIPRIDLYSYTSGGQPWINHEWLSEVIFGGLYLAGGANGIMLLKLLGFGVAFVLLRSIARQKGLVLEMRLLLAGLTISILQHGLAFRPQLFTYLLFTLLVHLLLAPGKKYRWLIPPLLLLWVNLHGGFLMGLAAVGVYTCCELAGAARAGRFRRFPALLGLAGASLLATLGNPYGWKLWAFLGDSLSRPRPNITEWQSVSLMSWDWVEFKVLCLVFLAAIGLSRRKKKPWLLVLTALCGLAALRYNRHMPFFAITCTLLLPEHIAASLARFGKPLTARLEQARGLLTPLYVLGAATLLCCIPMRYGRSACQLTVPADTYPVHAVRWMKASGISGNCAVFFNWGEYVIWHLKNRVRVSIDGRYRTVYPEEVIRKNFQLLYAEQGGEALLHGYPTDLVLMPNGFPVVDVLEQLPQWQPVFRSALATLFIRSSTPGAAQYPHPAAPPPAAAATTAFP